MRGGRTLEAGSFWDGGVFWYYNDVIRAKFTKRTAFCQKHDRLLAQGSKYAAYQFHITFKFPYDRRAWPRQLHTAPPSKQCLLESAHQVPLALPTSKVAGLGNSHGMDSLHASRTPPGELLQYCALPKSVNISSNF